MNNKVVQPVEGTEQTYTAGVKREHTHMYAGLSFMEANRRNKAHH